MLEKLVIICGGTGGHFYPGLSTAEELRRRGGEPLLFITGRNAEQQCGTASAKGIKSIILSSSTPPTGLPGKISFALHSLKGIIEARRKLREFKPSAVLAMGSFHSAAPAIAAWTLRIPVFVHDGNARVGKANLFLSNFARHMALSFPPVNSNNIKCKWTVTGMPVRSQIAECNLSKKEAIGLINSRHSVDLTEDAPLLLVFGGSQGAEAINQCVPEALKLQGRDNFQVVHLSGAKNRDSLEKHYAGCHFKHLVIETSGEMEIFYSAADLVICRSGGSTVAELSVFAKFAILIPYPFATDSHQDDNARYYCSGGAGIAIAEKELTVTKLASTIAGWLEQTDCYSQKGRLSKELAKPDASLSILQLIEGNLGSLTISE
ncbi:MAG: UDP-N-acetylglucosamine--N-acetylmuramyl-(pentapeptide) pyrophosphoryl-undecaprenol N-acetylglucosamine transferase [Victivallales bacterium]